MKIKFLKANNGDSILISFQDSDKIKRNILIDGGMPQTYFNSDMNNCGELYDVIEDMKAQGSKIDLLVLTHIDNDHIGGILKWIELDKEAHKLIHKVWFNSGKTIANYFHEKENEDLKIYLNIFNSIETSVRQGKKFEDYIEHHNIWEKEIIKFGKIADCNGVNIKILSPNDLLLKKLLKEFQKTKNKYFTDGPINDWLTSIKEFIVEENHPTFKFKKDNSVSNGSSIAFLLNFNKTNFLFLGDSHPDVIIASLAELGYDKKNPIQVELLKISHHGSCKNTSNELLEVIETNNYVICTNSELHNHPDKRTLARIINRNPNATIFFNYEVVRKNILSKKDFQDFKYIHVKETSEYIVKWE